MRTACLLFLCAALTLSAQTTLPRSVITATGQASVSVTPDQARIDASVVTQAATAQDAGNQNASITTNVIAQVKQALGTTGTVQTVSYSINPNYNSTGTLTGYTVTNTIQIVLNDLTRTGPVVDTATQAGATRINSLQFTLKDDSAPRSQALQSAVVKAKAKADAMASSLGLRTRAVLVIQESGAAIQSLVTSFAPTTATPVLPGDVSVQGNVTIEVELIQP